MVENAATRGQDILFGYGPIGVFCIILIAVIIVLWRKVNDDQDKIAALNIQLNAEVKSGISMAQDFRETFEKAFQAIAEQRRNH